VGAYSVNKEDIWISRIPVPDLVTAHADDDFESTAVGPLVPIGIFTVRAGRRSRSPTNPEPARKIAASCSRIATRTITPRTAAFPASERVWIEFKSNRSRPQRTIGGGRARANGDRTLLLALTEQGRIEVGGAAAVADLGALRVRPVVEHWNRIGSYKETMLNPNRRRLVLIDAPLSTGVSAVEAPVFPHRAVSRRRPPAGGAPRERRSAGSCPLSDRRPCAQA